MRPQLPDGYRVKYRHRRLAAGSGHYIDELAHGSFPIAPAAKGGETEARVYGPDDSLVAMGIATCHVRDSFSRRLGRDIALGRALKRLEEKQLMAKSEVPGA